MPLYHVKHSREFEKTCIELAFVWTNTNFRFAKINTIKARPKNFAPNSHFFNFVQKTLSFFFFDFSTRGKICSGFHHTTTPDLSRSVNERQTRSISRACRDANKYIVLSSSPKIVGVNWKIFTDAPLRNAGKDSPTPKHRSFSRESSSMDDTKLIAHLT